MCVEVGKLGNLKDRLLADPQQVSAFSGTWSRMREEPIPRASRVQLNVEVPKSERALLRGDQTVNCRVKVTSAEEISAET